ncbi:uncharacterized protein PHALS_08867 [Plasmopara halstedii]|uniref:Uncharacterized protein n=1 Tax=Plasmopara halstedii TaxID=4781 RepID=A0A0P1AE69_PLAHL|nr:uncharacterized protein PHALS_08867 [Plasmopara halstedii]CEG38815.1 hypothetical protein PHALS_08867 [Plasmopara halstedii]|eukprot:XP_024575184.1 hypothetical protein PHALS_08867 [Plasmopara halstedii]
MSLDLILSCQCKLRLAWMVKNVSNSDASGRINWKTKIRDTTSELPLNAGSDKLIRGADACCESLTQFTGVT